MSGDWQEIVFRERRSEKYQTRGASIAKGATVAAMSRTAMIRNQWAGNVARRKVMAGMCADSRFRKMILFKGLDLRPKPLIQLILTDLEVTAAPARTVRRRSARPDWAGSAAPS